MIKLNMSRNLFVLAAIARNRSRFYFVQRWLQTKTLRGMFITGHVTLGNDSCNLCRNKIAKQVARKIALCNSALMTQRVNCKCKSVFNFVDPLDYLNPILSPNCRIYSYFASIAGLLSHNSSIAIFFTCHVLYRKVYIRGYTYRCILFLLPGFSYCMR